MNIYEYAKQMEKDGEEFYRDLASKTDNKGLHTILTMLADEEVVHFKIIERMESEDPDAKLAVAPVLTEAKNIFKEMSSKTSEFNFSDSQIEMYQNAADIEQDNYNYYIEKAEEMPNEKYKEIFLQLAEEEKKHAHLLANIVEFVSRPIQWVEDAEFSTLDEY